MDRNILIISVLTICYVSLAHATPPTAPIHKSPGGFNPPGTCPVPSEEVLRCMRQWACQYLIRLDLRCLLNLNGNPLLGNLLGGSTPGGGGGGGILGGILGG